MGHSHDYHHQGVDGLVSLFTKANHDLNLVFFKLEKEFQQVYSDNVRIESCFEILDELLYGSAWFCLLIRNFLVSDEPHEACVPDQQNTGRIGVHTGAVSWASRCQTGILAVILVRFCVLSMYSTFIEEIETVKGSGFSLEFRLKNLKMPGNLMIMITLSVIWVWSTPEWMFLVHFLLFLWSWRKIKTLINIGWLKEESGVYYSQSKPNTS